MAVVGESCASLTPYGVGATLAQLGSGGLPNDKKPKRHASLGRATHWSCAETMGTGNGADLRTIQYTVQKHPETVKAFRLEVPDLAWQPRIQHRPNPPDHLRCQRRSCTGLPAQRLKAESNSLHRSCVRSPVREREVVRIARIMGQSSLSSVPRDTPLGVLQNP
ncbi:unnamed protein product [Cladocopium goreaui]|uniref:Uncharacterized protein n=1 Tax=Cladocopium goreaui TaxID=2562237 RepID=A0A9P1BUC2_9DINO|nr:unnamed protein product [Cladocopium goreaui]